MFLYVQIIQMVHISLSNINMLQITLKNKFKFWKYFTIFRKVGMRTNTHEKDTHRYADKQEN